MIIGLSGYARAGKDTVGQILVKNHGFRRVSFADKLREFALAIDPFISIDWRLSDAVTGSGWEGAKEDYPEVRRLLQVIGTDAGRNILGENVWVAAAFKDVEYDDDIVVTDVRFPNEYDAIHNAGGICWRVMREGTGPVNDHPSETALDGFLFRSIIRNNGTIEELERKVGDNLRFLSWAS